MRRVANMQEISNVMDEVSSNPHMRSATLIVNGSLSVQVTRRIRNKHVRRQEFVVTTGELNYKAKKTLKAARKLHKDPLPIMNRQYYKGK